MVPCVKLASRDSLMRLDLDAVVIPEAAVLGDQHRPLERLGDARVRHEVILANRGMSLGMGLTIAQAHEGGVGRRRVDERPDVGHRHREVPQVQHAGGRDASQHLPGATHP